MAKPAGVAVQNSGGKAKGNNKFEEK